MKIVSCGIFLCFLLNSTNIWGYELVHGTLFEVTGAGFGQRNVLKDIFDNASNTNVSTLWNDAVAVTYSTSIRSVPLPHSNISRYAVGNLTSGYNSWLSTYVTGISYPTNLFSMAYRRVDPNWAFGSECGTGSSQDNNFKFFTVSAGTSWFASPYWYHDQTNQKCSYNGSWDNSFYSSGGLGNLNTSYSGNQGGSSDSAYDLWHGWRKVEYRIGLGSSGQILKYLTNNKYYQNRTGQNTFGAGGSDGAFSIGVYPRQSSKSTQYHYMADVVMVIGPDAFKRVILSDSSSYTSSTIVEYQPISTWSDGSVKFYGNIGAIPIGTAYLHVFLNSSDTPVKTIPVTIGSQSDPSPEPEPPMGPPLNFRLID